MTRLYIYAAIALALGGLLWHDHHQTQRANRLAASVNALKADLAAERINTEKANAASTKYQADLTTLRDSRAADPLPAVMCKRARLPPAGTTPGPDAARPADDAPEDEGDRDIGPDLDDFATACEANLAQLTRLQEWVRNR